MAVVTTHPSLAAAREALADRRWFATTARGGARPQEVTLRPGDVFLFGPEPTGLPDEVLDAFAADRRLRLPMLPGNRSLNLSNAVAVVVYEAWRQNGFAGAE
jgi:tRNA (cytidine/uridine-2'-O-)-methyltransferase